jgi:hypothetical protein
MFWIDLALRWLHILSAVALGGSMIGWRFALLREAPSLADVVRPESFAAVRAGWSKLVMASSGLLLVTGLVNFVLILQRYELDKTMFPGSKYHMLFGIKFLFSFGIFALSALLTGRTGAAENLRRKERFWLNVNVLLVIAVICLGGLLRASARQPKPTQSSRPERQTERVVMDLSLSLTDVPSGE